MSVLNYAVEYIKREIPIEVLTEAFSIVENRYNQDSIYLTSTEFRIINEVVRGIVLKDVSLLRGMELDMILPSAPGMRDPVHNELVVKIPIEMTQNREIVSVMGISSGAGRGALTGLGGIGNGNNSGNLSIDRGCGPQYSYLMNQMSNVYNSIKGIGAGGLVTDFKATAEVVGPNTIRVIFLNYFGGGDLRLVVRVEYDPNLSDIKPPFWSSIGEASLLACKMYIHTNLSVRLESGRILSGQDMGVIKQIVDSYSSAAEDYKTYREEKLIGELFFNQVDVVEEHIRTIGNPFFS